MNEMKRELCMLCAELYARKLVSGTDGNVSLRADGQSMFITPSGVNKGKLKPDNILLQGFDGGVIEGNMRSSKEAGMHSKIYSQRADIHAIIHTHPAAATAFAACGKTLPMDILIEAPVLLGKMTMVPYAQPGSADLADAVEELARTNDILFLKNHGIIVMADSMQKAFDMMDALENVALSIIYANLVGGVQKIPQEELAKLM